MKIEILRRGLEGDILYITSSYIAKGIVSSDSIKEIII